MNGRLPAGIQGLLCWCCLHRRSSCIEKRTMTQMASLKAWPMSLGIESFYRLTRPICASVTGKIPGPLQQTHDPGVLLFACAEQAHYNSERGLSTEVFSGLTLWNFGSRSTTWLETRNTFHHQWLQEMKEAHARRTCFRSKSNSLWLE